MSHERTERSRSVRARGSARWGLGHSALPTVPRPCCSSSTPIVVSIREPSPLFCAASRDPPWGLSRHAANPTVGRTVKSLVERSASFSALLLHETKSRLVNHDFLPIGRLLAVRRAAWQEGDHRVAVRPGLRLARETSGVGNHLRAGSGRILPAARDVRRTPVRPTFARKSRNRFSPAAGSEPLPRGVVGRAASASLRRQPLNAAAWLALRARLWSERSRGLMRPDEVLRPLGSGTSSRTVRRPSAVPDTATTPSEEQTGIRE